MDARIPRNRMGDARFVFVGGRDLEESISIFAFSRLWGASRFSCWSRCCRDIDPSTLEASSPQRPPR